MSAKELSEECDVSQSTIYRRIEEMQAHDLLVERTQLKSDGSHYSVYKANINHIDIEIDNGIIEVRMHIKEDAAKRFSRIWNNIRGN